MTCWDDKPYGPGPACGSCGGYGRHAPNCRIEHPEAFKKQIEALADSMLEKETTVKEMSEALTHEIHSDRSGTWSQQSPELHQAAVKWAEHSLKTYKGQLLTQALGLSKAIAEFLAELESPGCMKDESE